MKRKIPFLPIYLISEKRYQAAKDHYYNMGMKFGRNETQMLQHQMIEELLGDGVIIDGEHHKQWHLEQVAKHFGVKLPEHDPGIAP